MEAPAMAWTSIQVFFPFTQRPQARSRHHLCNHRVNASACAPWEWVLLQGHSQTGAKLCRMSSSSSVYSLSHTHTLLVCTLYWHSWKLKGKLVLWAKLTSIHKNQVLQVLFFAFVSLASLPLGTLLFLSRNKKNSKVKLTFFICYLYSWRTITAAFPRKQQSNYSKYAFKWRLFLIPGSLSLMWKTGKTQKKIYPTIYSWF